MSRLLRSLRVVGKHLFPTPWEAARKNRALKKGAKFERDMRQAELFRKILLYQSKKRNKFPEKELEHLLIEKIKAEEDFYDAHDKDPQHREKETLEKLKKFDNILALIQGIEGSGYLYDQKYQQDMAALAARMALYRIGVHAQNRKGRKIHRVIRRLIAAHPTISGLEDIRSELDNLLHEKTFNFFHYYRTFYSYMAPQNWAGAEVDLKD